MKLTKKKIKNIIKTGTAEEITNAIRSYIPVLLSKRKKIFSDTPIVYTEEQKMFI
jgi:hypothetical protein